MLPESDSSVLSESPVGSGVCWERRPEELGAWREGQPWGGQVIQADRITGWGRGTGMWRALGPLDEDRGWQGYQGEGRAGVTGDIKH